METKAPCLKIPHSNHKHLKLLAELNIFVFSKRKGVPNKCTVDNNKTFVLPSIHKLPTSAAAVAAHENEGGHVTFLEVFRVDLFTGNHELQKLHNDNFKAIYPTFDGFFYSLVNGNYHPLQQGLPFFIDQTTALNLN